MGETIQPRKKVFAWQTKQELYEYFEGAYNLKRSVIDEEIEEVLKIFKLRKGEPINPQELWEKVGANLEKHLNRDTKKIKSEISEDIESDT